MNRGTSAKIVRIFFVLFFFKQLFIVQSFSCTDDKLNFASTSSNLVCTSAAGAPDTITIPGGNNPYGGGASGPSNSIEPIPNNITFVISDFDNNPAPRVDNATTCICGCNNPNAGFLIWAHSSTAGHGIAAVIYYDFKGDGTIDRIERYEEFTPPVGVAYFPYYGCPNTLAQVIGGPYQKLSHSRIRLVLFQPGDTAGSISIRVGSVDPTTTQESYFLAPESSSTSTTSASTSSSGGSSGGSTSATSVATIGIATTTSTTVPVTSGGSTTTGGGATSTTTGTAESATSSSTTSSGPQTIGLSTTTGSSTHGGTTTSSSSSSITAISSTASSSTTSSTISGLTATATSTSTTF